MQVGVIRDWVHLFPMSVLHCWVIFILMLLLLSVMYKMFPLVLANCWDLCINIVSLFYVQIIKAFVSLCLVGCIYDLRKWFCNPRDHTGVGITAVGKTNQLLINVRHLRPARHGYNNTIKNKAWPSAFQLLFKVSEMSLTVLGNWTQVFCAASKHFNH